MNYGSCFWQLSTISVCAHQLSVHQHLSLCCFKLLVYRHRFRTDQVAVVIKLLCGSCVNNFNYAVWYGENAVCQFQLSQIAVSFTYSGAQFCSCSSLVSLLAARFGMAAIFVL
jgi:hypothetical protein